MILVDPQHVDPYDNSAVYFGDTTRDNISVFVRDFSAYVYKIFPLSTGHFPQIVLNKSAAYIIHIAADTAFYFIIQKITPAANKFRIE